MNIIKKLFRSLAKLISKEKFKKCYIGTKDYVLSLTFVKVTAIIVVNCFLLTCVYGQGVAAVIDNSRTATQFKQIFDDFSLPYSYGKITSANFAGSDTVVINIQDLHSHPEVQRNINNIISLFDEKYGVKNIYLEGAYGQVSTKWLTVAKDETVKKSVMNKLLEAGRLTGAEYFSASKNKTEIIKGLEDKAEYFDNLKRFGQIIDNQNIINVHLNEINETVKQLQSKYYNRQQQKIEELSAQYISGDIDAKKYFTLMKKHADKLGVDIDSYQNLSLYIDLMEKQKEINYSKTTQELQVLVVELKKVLPYGAYKMLLEQTKSFTQMDKLYGYIIKLSKQYNLDLSINFPELEKFFGYIELSQKINPLELVKEEQNFKDEINDRFSTNKAEEEVVFLSSFVRYYRDYLNGKITPDDCKYYKANIDRFKYVWVKYIDNKEVVALEDYETISDTFYKINFARNNYFVENMKDVFDGKKISNEVAGNNELQKTMNSLQKAKEVYITVTGGFHTQDLSELLTKAGVTNMVITPNVTGDTKVAEETYYRIAQEQAKISFQALAALDSSQAAFLYGDKDAIRDIIKAVKDSDKVTENNINDLFKEMIDASENSSVESMLYNQTSNFISVEMKNGKQYYYDVKKDEWQGTEGVNEVQQKSLGSIRSTLNIVEKVAALSSAAAIVTTLYIFTPVVAPFLPAVAIISVLASIFGWSSVALKNYEQSQLEIAKAKSLESDETDEDFVNRLEDKLKELGFKESDIAKIDLASTNDSEFGNVEKGAVHLNRSIINSLFMDGTDFKVNNSLSNVLSNALFSMFVAHELRHIKHPGWAETFVGALDIFNFISAYIRNLLKYISTKGFSSKSLSKKEGEKSPISETKREKIETVVKRDFFSNYDKDSNQSKDQFEFAENLSAKDGKVAVMPTSGGKTLGSTIAVYNKVLDNNNSGMADNKILFTSKTNALIDETVQSFVTFFSAPEIITDLSAEQQKAAEEGKLIGFVDESKDTGYFVTAKRNSEGELIKDEKGNIVLEKKETTKKEVYENATVICGTLACFGWDVQGNKDEKNKDNYIMQRINEKLETENIPFNIFIDEAQLVTELNNLSTSSSKESKRAKDLEPVVEAISGLVGEGKIINKNFINEDNRLSDKKRIGRKSGTEISNDLFKEYKDKAEFKGLGITKNEWDRMVNNAVTAYYDQTFNEDYEIIAVDENNKYLTIEVDGNNVKFTKNANEEPVVISKEDYKVDENNKINIDGIEYQVKIGIKDKETSTITPSVSYTGGLQGALERVANENGLLPANFGYTVETLTSSQNTGVTYLLENAKSVHAFTGSTDAAIALAEALESDMYIADSSAGAKPLLNSMELVETNEEQMIEAAHKTVSLFFGVFNDENGKKDKNGKNLTNQSGLIFVNNSEDVNRYNARIVVEMRKQGLISDAEILSLEKEQDNILKDLIEAKNNGDEDKIKELNDKLNKNSEKILQIANNIEVKISGETRTIGDIICKAKNQDSEIVEVKNKLEEKPRLAILTNIGSTGMDIKYDKDINGVFVIDANDQRTEENDYQTGSRIARNVENPSVAIKVSSKEQILDNLDSDKRDEYESQLSKYMEQQKTKKEKSVSVILEKLKEFGIEIDDTEDIKDENDVLIIIKGLDSDKKQKFIEGMYKEYKYKYDVDFQDIKNYASDELKMLQLLSYINPANIYNDMEVKKDSNGWYRRDRTADTENSGLANLISLIKDEKTQSDKVQNSLNDLTDMRQSRVFSDRFNSTKNKYMGENWLSNISDGKLSDKDYEKLGKYVVEKYGLIIDKDNVDYVSLGKDYLEQLRIEAIDRLSETDSLTREAIAQEERNIRNKHSNKIQSRFRSMISSQATEIVRVYGKYENDIPEADQQIRTGIADIFKEAGINTVSVDTKIYKEKKTVSKILATGYDWVVNKGAMIVTPMIAIGVAYGIMQMLSITALTVSPVILGIIAIVGMIIILTNIYLRRAKVDRYEAYKQQRGGYEYVTAEFVNTGNFKLLGKVAEGSLYNLSAVMGKMGIYAPAFAFIAGIALVLTGGLSFLAIGVLMAGLVMSVFSLITSIAVIKVNTNTEDGIDIDSQAVSDMKDVPTNIASNILSGLVVSGISTLITTALISLIGIPLAVSAVTVGIFLGVSLLIYGLYYVLSNVLPAKYSRKISVEQKNSSVLKSLVPSFAGFAITTAILAFMMMGAVSVATIGTAIMGILFMFSLYGMVLQVRSEIENANGDNKQIAKAIPSVLKSYGIGNPMVLFSGLAFVIGGIFTGQIAFVLVASIVFIAAMYFVSRIDNPKIEKAILVLLSTTTLIFGLSGVVSAASVNGTETENVNNLQQQSQEKAQETTTANMGKEIKTPVEKQAPTEENKGSEVSTAQADVEQNETQAIGAEKAPVSEESEQQPITKGTDEKEVEGVSVEDNEEKVSATEKTPEVKSSTEKGIPSEIKDLMDKLDPQGKVTSGWDSKFVQNNFLNDDGSLKSNYNDLVEQMIKKDLKTYNQPENLAKEDLKAKGFTVKEEKDSKNNYYLNISDNKGHSTKLYLRTENGKLVKNPTQIVDKIFKEWGNVEKQSGNGKYFKVKSSVNGKLIIENNADGKKFEIDIFSKDYNAKGVGYIQQDYYTLVKNGHDVEIKYDNNGYVYYRVDGKDYYPFDSKGVHTFNPNDLSNSGNSGNGNYGNGNYGNGNYGNGYFGGGLGGYYNSGSNGYRSFGMVPERTGVVDIPESEVALSDSIETEEDSTSSWIPSWVPSWLTDFFGNFISGLNNMIDFIFGNSDQAAMDNTGIGFSSLLQRMSINADTMSPESIQEMKKFGMPIEYFKGLKGYDASGKETTDPNKIVEYKNDNVIWRKETDNAGKEIWFCYENNNGEPGEQLMMLQEVRIEAGKSETQYAFTDLKNIKIDVSAGLDANNQYSTLVPIAYANEGGTIMTFQRFGDVNNGDNADFIDPQNSIPESEAMLDLVSGEFIYTSQTYAAVISEFAKDPKLRDLITNNCEGFDSEHPFCPNGQLDKPSLDFIRTFLTTVKCDNKGNPYIWVEINGVKTACPLIKNEGGKLTVLNEATGQEFTIDQSESLGYVIEASDIAKQAGTSNHTGMNQLKVLLTMYSNFSNADIDHINTIYPTMNYEQYQWVRMDIQPKEKGLSSDNIRQMYQFLYQSNRSGNGNVFLGVEAINGIPSSNMSSEEILDVALNMNRNIDDEYSFVEHMVNYNLNFGIFTIPGTDLLQLANIEIPGDIFNKGSKSIISNDSWNTIREQGLTEKGENSWVYGQENDAGLILNFLYKDTGPDKFISEHTHSALISFGGYFYLFIVAVIGYRTAKKIKNGLEKIKNLFVRKIGGGSGEKEPANIYEEIDALDLETEEGTDLTKKLEKLEKSSVCEQIFIILGNGNKEVGKEKFNAIKTKIENEQQPESKVTRENITVESEDSLDSIIKQNVKNAIKDAQFDKLNEYFNEYREYADTEEIAPNAKKYINSVPGLIENDSHVQLLNRMIETGLITFKDLEEAFKEVSEKQAEQTTTGEIGPMNQLTEILLGKAVENEYEQITEYLPIESETVKNHILELRGRLYHQLLVEPTLIKEDGNIENGENRNAALQMSQQDLREMIVANILMLRPSLTMTDISKYTSEDEETMQALSLGSDTIPSTLNLARLILRDIDNGTASKEKTIKRIGDFITFTENFVKFNQNFKPASTEPNSATRVEWSQQVEQDNYYIDTNHILMFMFLDTDENIYGDKKWKDIDIFNLTEQDLAEKFEVKGEKVTLFENVLKLKGFELVKGEESGTINLIASINNYLKNGGDEKAFGRAINEDISNMHRILVGDSELSRYEDFAKTQQEKSIDNAINGRKILGVKVGSGIFDNFELEAGDYIYKVPGNMNYDRFVNNSNLYKLLKEANAIPKEVAYEDLDLGKAMKAYVLAPDENNAEPSLKTKRERLTNLRTALNNDLYSTDGSSIIDAQGRRYARDMIYDIENLETNYGQSFSLRFLNALSIYRRTLKNIFGYNFWNIETRAQRIQTHAVTGIFVALILAVFLFFTPAGLSLIPWIVGALGKTAVGNIILAFAAGIKGSLVSVIGTTGISSISGLIGVASHDIIMTLAVSALLLPKMIVGKATDGDMKRNILGVTSAFAVYYGGFLGGFFVRGIAISLFSGGMFPVFALLTIAISFSVWLFIGIPTFASFWHIMIGTKSNKIEKAKNKELSAHNAMEKRISWQKRSSLAFGIGAVAGIGWLTSLVFSFLVTPIYPPFMLLALGIVVVFFIASGVMALWSRMYLGNKNKKENFGKLWFSDVYELIIKSENSDMFISDLEATVETAYNRLWISKKERESMLNAIKVIKKGIDEGKSMKEIEKSDEMQKIGLENLSPTKMEIRNMFEDYFSAHATEKAPIPDWSKIPPMGEHTQAYSEQGRWTIQDIIAKGDFHKGTSQFTRLAAQFKESFWANACERIDDILADSMENPNIKLSDSDKKTLLELANTLRNIEETTELKSATDLGLSGDAQTVYNDMLSVACTFMESTLGSQETVMETQYEDHVQFHKTLALDQGDLRYAKIVNKINVVYGTLDEAIADNGKKIVSDKINMEDEFDSRKITTEDFEYFKEKFEIYDPEVRKKHKMAVTDFSLYQQAEIVEESRDYRKELSFEEAMLSDAELKERKDEIIAEKEPVILREELQSLRQYHYTTNLSENRMLEIIKELDKNEELIKYSNQIDGKINFVGDVSNKIDEILSNKKYEDLSEADKAIIKKYVVKRKAFYKLDRHALNLLALGDKYNTIINYVHPDDETALRGNKNAQLRTALSSPETGLIGTAVLMERDAFVSNALGQSQFCVNANMDYEENGYLCLNLPMQGKGNSLTSDSGDAVFPVGASYSGAIRDWTQGTQSAYGSNLTYYGKGVIRSEGIIAIGWTNPGEDSNSIYINFLAHSLGEQKVSHEKQAIAGYLQYYRLDWIRPTTTNVVGSEGRYSSNVYRMLYDPFSTIYEKTNSVGYDWKLSNIMMAAHYINTILSVMFALFLPLAVIFSSFAFLMPFILSFAVSTVFMLAINLTKINAEARKDGDFFTAMKRTLKDLVSYFPFWVAMQPVMALFGSNASNGVYKFLSTYKDMKLQQDRDVEGVYDFVGSVGSNIGTAGYILTGLYLLLIVVFTLSNPLAFGIWLGALKAILGIIGAILVSSFYIMANAAYINGLNSYNAKMDENGKVIGEQTIGTVYKPAAQSLYKAPRLLYRYFRDLFKMLRNKEPEYLDKMNYELNEKEQVIENTDISLKMISDILNKEEKDRTPEEQKIVNKLVEKYKEEKDLGINSEQDLKEFISDVKDKVEVLSPADMKLKEINEEVNNAIVEGRLSIRVRSNGVLATLDNIQSVLEKEDKTPEEKELVAFLTSQYGKSVEDFAKEVLEIKKKNSVNKKEISPAGQEMKKIAGFITELISEEVKVESDGILIEIDEQGNTWKTENGKKVKVSKLGYEERQEIKDQLKELQDKLNGYKEALDIDIRNSFDYNLNKGYENFLTISRNFLNKHPFIKAIFRPVITGVAFASVFSVISTFIMSFTAFSSTVAPMTILIFLTIAVIWSLYNLGSALAKENGSYYLKLFSFITWAGVPAILYFMAVPTVVLFGFAVGLAVVVFAGYALQKRKGNNAKEKLETKFNEIDKTEFAELVRNRLKVKKEEGIYTQEEIEKDFDRVLRETIDEVLVEELAFAFGVDNKEETRTIGEIRKDYNIIDAKDVKPVEKQQEKYDMLTEMKNRENGLNSYLSQIYNDIETASNAKISFFLQEKFNKSIGGTEGLINSTVNRIEAKDFMESEQETEIADTVKDDNIDNNDEGNTENLVNSQVTLEAGSQPLALPAGSQPLALPAGRTEIEDETPATVQPVEKEGSDITDIEETPEIQESSAVQEQQIDNERESNIVSRLKETVKSGKSLFKLGYRLAGNWAISLFLNRQNNIELETEFVDDDNYTKLASIPGIFISKADIERMSDETSGILEEDENGEKTLLKNKDGEIVARLNNDKLVIVSDSPRMNGREVTFKYKAVTVERDGKTVVQFRPFNTDSLSAKIFECLDIETQSNLNIMAGEALCNRISYDMNIVDKLIGKDTQNKEKEVKNLVKQLYNSVKNNDNYTFQEKKIIFGTESNVSHSGMKTVDVEMKNRNSFITVCDKAKKAQADEIVLTTKKDKAITREEVKYAAEQAWKYGLRLVVEINGNNTDMVEDEYLGIDHVSGFRFANEGLYNGELAKTIEKNGKEVSVKVNNIDNIDLNIKDDKTVYVVDPSKCDFDNNELVTNLQSLAENGRVKLYYEDDKNVTEEQQKQVEKVFGKNAKTMISLGKTYITNRFASLFNKNYVSMYFSEGLETDVEDIFNGNVNEVVPVLKMFLSKEDFTRKQLNDLIKNNPAIFTDKFLNTVRSIDNNENIEENEKIPAIRQFVIGTLINYVESDMPAMLKQNSELTNVNFNNLNKKALEQVEYRVIQLLMTGRSLEQIVEEIAKQKSSGRETLAEMLSKAYDSNIDSQWIKTDMIIEPISDGNVAEAEMAIKVLLMDTILPEGNFDETFATSLEGISSILAAA